MKSNRSSRLEALLEDTQRQVSELVGPSFIVVVSITCTGTTGVTPPVADTLLSVEEVAALLRKAPSTVRELMRGGEIPAHKKGNRWYTTSRALLEKGV